MAGTTRLMIADGRSLAPAASHYAPRLGGRDIGGAAHTRQREEKGGTGIEETRRSLTAEKDLVLDSGGRDQEEYGIHDQENCVFNARMGLELPMEYAVELNRLVMHQNGRQRRLGAAIDGKRPTLWRASLGSILLTPRRSDMKLNLKPLGDRVVIEPMKQEDTTASGLVLPDTAKEKPQKGVILAAGAGARGEDGKRLPLDVRVGDTVVFARYAGTEFKVDGDKLLILKESDLLAIVLAGAGGAKD